MKMTAVSTPFFALMYVLIMTPAQAEQRWHPLQEYTVEYKMTGTQTGTAIWHSRHWGREMVQINDFAMKVAGMSIPTRNQVITKGAEIITIDLTKNTATRMQNPMYDNLAKQMQGQDPAEFGKQMMRNLGHKETGETKSVAGESCNIWANQQLGQKICITDDGLTLWTHTGMMGMTIEQTATRVDRGNGGPDSAYEVPAGMKVTDGPALPNFGQ